MICYYLETSQQKVLKKTAFIHVLRFGFPVQLVDRGYQDWYQWIWPHWPHGLPGSAGGNVDDLERGPGIINDDLLTMRMVSFIKGHIKKWSDPGLFFEIFLESSDSLIFRGGWKYRQTLLWFVDRLPMTSGHPKRRWTQISSRKIMRFSEPSFDSNTK